MRIISSTVALASLALAACVANPTPSIDKAIPTADQVAIKLPDKAPQSGAANLVGDLAGWYVVTRDVTRTLNGGTAWVLVVVHAVVQYPPTTVDGDTYTWGPWSGALDPAEYRLVATERTDGSFDWTLDGRSKLAAGTAFETVISGNAVPGAVEGQGHGTFTIDFDAAERVNPIDNNASGQVAIAYDLAARHLDMAITNAQGNFDYTYQEGIDGSGDMVFESIADTDDPGTAAEDSLIHSRWMADGEGRADARVTAGDLGSAEVTASQCWDGYFGETFYTDSANFHPTEGTEASCVFPTASLPPN